MGKKLNTIKFIEISNKVHGDKYDYSLVKYFNNKTKVKIICPKHGTFEQRPDAHVNGFGCSKCTYDNKKSNNDVFLKRANEIHDNKYDYSLVEYINAKTKIKIICPKHGIFEQTPGTHINQKHGCLKCQGQNKSSLEFIEECSKIHNNKYDYSLVEYINSIIKVKIICPVHGIFEQKPNDHRKGCGCPMCNISKGETIIKKYLGDNNIKYIQHYSFNDCKNKNLLWFDFYLLDKNTCIEYDGIQHYEPIEYFGGINGLKYIMKNDRIKDRYCKKMRINLIRFKYNENIDFNLI